MKKQKKQLIILLVLLVLVIGGYMAAKYLVSHKEVLDDSINVTEVLHLDKDSLTEVCYIHDGVTVDLVRKDNEWKLKDDENIKLDQEVISDIVGFAAFLNCRGTIEEPAALEEYGLDVPSYIVEVTDGKGVSNCYYIGDASAVDGTYFARLEGTDVVYKIAATYPQAFITDLEQLKAK